MQRNPEGRTSGLKAWLPLLVLAGAVFCFNSSEFMPIGLLSDIGEDLGVANSTMGLLITVYAWVVCLMSVPLMVVCSRLEYRNLLLGTIALFAISHVGSALSASYGFLMASRIGVACAHSVFWSIAPPIAVKLAPEGKRAAALSLIATSTSGGKPDKGVGLEERAFGSVGLLCSRNGSLFESFDSVSRKVGRESVRLGA